jgi:type VI secretion system protein ImpL
MPVSIDAGARAAGLRLDGVDIIADRAPPRTAQMTWPGPVGGAIFAVEPVAGTGEFTEQGPWAVFKLFDRAQIKPVGDHAQASFRIGERQAVFDVKASGAMNPLLRGALQEFRCPVVQ